MKWKMKINVLVAEIGSTTTVVNAFGDIHSDCPRFLGQGQASTTVMEGDVNIGLQNAIEDLERKLDIQKLHYDEMLATSSAAGGLKMTVHGLVYDMTVKAAKEAALGAGAIIHKVTSGKLRTSDLNAIMAIKPNLVLIAGGVDYGERDTAIYNAEQIAGLDIHVPIVYAGNVENQEEIREVFNNKKKELYIVENVYPKIDQLNIEPTRNVIQKAFEEHIIHAPGMTRVRDLVTGPIIPTPGAVMEASKLLREEIGDLITLDVGGATTDVHSVTEGSDEMNRILISPEPMAKRTVEGDIGVYVNRENIVNRIGKNVLQQQFVEDIDLLIKNSRPIPKSTEETKFVEVLTREAVITAMIRHAGKLRHLYGPTGKKTLAEGKDLTSIKWIIGTGGALTRLPNGPSILKEIPLYNKGDYLFPTMEAQVLIDRDYIMASLGVLSKKYPNAALRLMLNSIRKE